MNRCVVTLFAVLSCALSPLCAADSPGKPELAVTRGPAVPLSKTYPASPQEIIHPSVVSPKNSALSTAVFIENVGQFDPQVLYQVKMGTKTAWLTKGGIVFDATRPAATENTGATSPEKSDGPRGHPGLPVPAIELNRAKIFDRLVFAEDFAAGTCCSKVEGANPLPGTYNYFQSSDRTKWRTNVRAYRKVVYRDVWPGIDVQVYDKNSDLEQEFVVRPGGDLRRVQISYRGVNRVAVAQDGTLEVDTAFGTLRETRPSIYQQIGNKTVAVEGRFKLTSGTSYVFDVEPHQSEYALVLDPTLLYSTYLGGSAGNDVNSHNNEIANGVAVNSFGEAYVVGYTLSTDFPVTTGAFQTSPASGSFITKLDATGSSLVYSTYLGKATYINAIAVDSAGRSYVTGETYGSAFPITANAYRRTDSTPCSSTDFFITELNSVGSGLLYSSCFGIGDPGGFYYYPKAIAVGSNGLAYVAGGAGAGYPTTANAYQPSFPGGSSAFVTVFDTAASGASSLVYSTYLGAGVGQDALAYGIAVDSFGKAYITGSSLNGGFPTTPGAFQPSHSPCQNGVSGCVDAFVAKLDPSASGLQSLIYSTLLGGVAFDSGYGIAVDTSGSAYVTGTTSGNFPVTPGAFQTAYNACGAFVTKLNAGGSGLIYSTYLPGSYCTGTSGNGIAVDALGNAYVTGGTNSATFPVTADAFQSKPVCGTGCGSAFLTELNPTGSTLVYSSYLGGSLNDIANAVVLDQAGDAYVAGLTSSPDFPTTTAAFQPTLKGTGDAFVAKFPLGGTFRVLQILPSSGGNSGNFSPTIIGTGFHAGLSVKLSGGGSDITASDVTIGPDALYITPTFNLQGAAIGVRNVVVTNPDGVVITLPQSFTVQSGTPPNIRLQKSSTIAVPGRTTTYTITVTNSGNTDSGIVRVVEALEPWFTFVSSNPVPSTVRPAPASFPPGGTGNYNAFLEWDLTNVAAGASDTVSYTVFVDPSTVIGHVVRGTACHLCLYPGDTCEDLYRNCLITQGQACAGPMEFCMEADQACLDIYVSCMTGECHPSGAPAPAPTQAPTCTNKPTPVLASADPNDLTGPTGSGSAHWVPGPQPLSYSIEFANMATAAVPAQKVVVSQVLDTGVDLNTLALSSINLPNGTASVMVSVPRGSFDPRVGLTEFTAVADLRPTQPLLVNVDAKLNTATRTLTWTLASVDPTTGQPPLDPTVGLLPPSTGGSVFFNVAPQAGLVTGTRISDQAAVVFDANAPLNTPTWLNTIDNSLPLSRVVPLPTLRLSTSFPVQWSGTDVGAGIQDYTVYVSDSGGPFTAWLTNTTANQGTFLGEDGHSYAFYSIARDLVGNVEGPKSTAEATTTVQVVPTGVTAQFSDVPPTSAYFDAANLMYETGVTVGCVGGSTPQMRSYCPNDNVTREQMAAFIVRAVTGETTPALYNPTPYFADVPTTNSFFPHIQKLMELGITVGCDAGPPALYCPGQTIPRWQMAIFMVRARLALHGAAFTTATIPYFADAPTTVDGGASFPFIQRSYEEHVTVGCGTNPLIYCPDAPVTRGQMASFIMRALFNKTTILGPTDLQLTGVIPNTMDATLGTQITVTITGVNTNFQTGDTVTVPSEMLDVNSVIVNSATSITATLTTNAITVPAPQSLVVTTSGQNLTLPLAIKVGTY